MTEPGDTYEWEEHWLYGPDMHLWVNGLQINIVIGTFLDDGDLEHHSITQQQRDDTLYRCALALSELPIFRDAKDQITKPACYEDRND